MSRLLCVFAVFCALAASAVQAEEPRVEFNIPSQPLDGALKAFAAATGQQVLAPSEAVAGLKSAELKGAFTADEGLKKLLVGLPVEAKRTDARTLAIARLPDTAIAKLPEVTVKAEPPPVAPPPPEPIPEPTPPAPTADVGYRGIAPAAVLRAPIAIADAPRAIQVIPKQLIQDLNSRGVEDSLGFVSNVTFQGSEDGRNTKFSIRGFADAPVLRDGFLVEQFGVIAAEPYNLERIEVLKGPDSIQYGESDPGGLINLVRKKPIRNEKFIEAEFTYGSLGTATPAVDINGWLNCSKTVHARLVSLYTFEESWRDFDNPNHKVLFAPSVTWDIAPETSVTFVLDYTFQDGFVDFGQPPVGSEPANIDRKMVVSNRDATLEKQQFFTGYDFDHKINCEWKLQNRFRFVSDDYNYSSVFLPFAGDPDTNSVLRFPADQEQSTHQYFLQTTLTGEHDFGFLKNKINAGVDARYSEFFAFTLFDTANPSVLDLSNPDYNAEIPDRSTFGDFNEDGTEVKRVSLFAQDHLYIGQHVILSAGLRYDAIGYETHSFLTNNTSSAVEQKVLPQGGITIKPISDLSIYANYSQSFNPNFASSNSFGGAPGKPETGQGYEAGVKYEFLNKRMFATASVFHIEKQNVSSPDPDNPLLTITTGEQQSRGFEFDITGQPLPGWNLIASYGLLDTEITEDPVNQGNELFSAPRHQASIWSTYEIQCGDLKGLGFGAGINHVGERYGDNANSFRADDYTIPSASVFYKRDNWRLNIKGENLADRDYIRGLNGFDYSPGPPLNVVATFTIRF